MLLFARDLDRGNQYSINSTSTQYTIPHYWVLPWAVLPDIRLLLIERAGTATFSYRNGIMLIL